RWPTPRCRAAAGWAGRRRRRRGRAVRTGTRPARCLPAPPRSRRSRLLLPASDPLVRRPLVRFHVRTFYAHSCPVLHDPANVNCVLTTTRRDAILAELHDHGEVAVGHLAARFGVSTSTIRRDLNLLSKQGRLQRVRGGGAAEPAAPDRK